MSSVVVYLLLFDVSRIKTMRWLLNVDQALKLFFELEENVEADSEPESDECDDEVDDPLFVLEEVKREGEEEQPLTSTQSVSRRSAER